MKTSQKGFSAVIALIVVLVIAAVGFSGWYVWKKNQKKDRASTTQTQTQTTQNQSTQNDTPPQPDETADWITVTTQSKDFSMRAPDGWKLTSYPGNYVGGTSVTYKAGERATIETSGSEYMGHSLRFRASIASLEEGGVKPQWASPQPGLEESTSDFSVGGLMVNALRASLPLTSTRRCISMSSTSATARNLTSFTSLTIA